MDKVHPLALKKLFNVSPRTPSDLAYGETDRFPLYIHSYTACIKYWLRLTRMDISRLPRKAYNTLLLVHNINSGKLCRAPQGHQVLYKVSFGFVWESQRVQNPEIFTEAFKKKKGGGGGRFHLLS